MAGVPGTCICLMPAVPHPMQHSVAPHTKDVGGTKGYPNHGTSDGPGHSTHQSGKED